jgi:putative 4-mercaptohistidine N1-methyltranferase
MKADNPYETQKLVDEYLLFHYGADEEILPWKFGPREALGFPVRTVSETFDWSSVPEHARALDIGCAVGRSSFELARRCAEVVGIDFSQAFVDAAEKMRVKGRLDYRCLEEAATGSTLTAARPEGVEPDRVRFVRGDAMDLDGDLGTFDLVHAANLVCRLSDPGRFLSRLPDLVRSAGQLVLTTPCTWLEEFTPMANWPTASTLDLLKRHLEGTFILRRLLEMPFLIREHRRKFQWTVAQASVWERLGHG